MTAICTQSFDETRAIRALVVPIGPNTLYDEQYEQLSRFKELPLFEVRPNNWNVKDTPFKYINWDQGCFLFDYVRYDRVTPASKIYELQ